ncbi:30S ribosomal protein S1 [Bacillus cereus]|uniref:30S ribosomal protein S1 n=1 Tax=Paenibacillus melissococcoides TaxID=2912268 RepID=UPI0021C2605A|nr:30S ribosomal protein S1 [Paenibacillus melissococcoides]MEB9896278.1 30S ribosomal protein S1 [Bacillus cereus]CAH8721289.1 30S ribosomal protein S1 [Paenibacillus melissococcoides]
MNDLLNTNPMQEYVTSLKRNKIHQGVVVGVETHAPFGEKMQCAVVELKNGLKGLIYEGQFDTHKYRSLVGFIDHTIDFMVLDVSKQGLDPEKVNVFDEEKGIVLLSRVQALEELQEEFWETADVDHVCTGHVSGFEDERLYILVQGVVCVLPIQDYEYDWTPSGRNLIPLGTKLTVKIKKIDRAAKQVRVTRKELLEDPWLRVREKFNVGDSYRGVITGAVENKGIFVKLAPGIESLAWFPERVPSHGELMGKTVAVKIKNINPEGKRMRTKIVNFPHELY